MDYGNLKSRKRLMKAGLWFCLFLISIWLFILLGFFTEMNLAQSKWNQVHIYSNLNYYQENILEVAQKNAHLLDIYQPKDCQTCPVIIYIHGGTWVLGDKGGLSYKAKAFTSQDYVYVSINYRLSPDYQFPTHAYDVARAFFWIKNNIQHYGGHPDKIYLLGHSAGGHLAALIALDKRYLAAFGLASSDISGIIGLDSAAYHLPSLFAAEPENQYLFSWAFGDNPEDWEKASPINYVREGLNIPPFLLLVAGGREVSKTVNQIFDQKLDQYGYDVSISYFEEKNHVSIDYDLGKEDDAIFAVILGWLLSRAEKN